MIIAWSTLSWSGKRFLIGEPPNPNLSFFVIVTVKNFLSTFQGPWVRKPCSPLHAFDLLVACKYHHALGPWVHSHDDNAVNCARLHRKVWWCKKMGCHRLSQKEECSEQTHFSVYLAGCRDTIAHKTPNRLSFFYYNSLFWAPFSSFSAKEQIHLIFQLFLAYQKFWRRDIQDHLDIVEVCDDTTHLEFLYCFNFTHTCALGARCCPGIKKLKK